MLNHLLPLQRALNNAKTAGKTVVVLGIGAELRGDDIAGVLVARGLSEANIPGIRALEGCSAPENFTGEVIAADPGVVLFVDAANLGLTPGECRLIEQDRIKGTSFSTHTLPLHLILSYLSQSIPAEFFVLGIQPKDTGVLVEPSEEILEAVRRTVDFLVENFQGC